MIKALMLGAGRRKPARALTAVNAKEIDEWVTLDLMENTNPDVLYDLTDLHAGGELPFEDESFDEIHAYQVLEHVGRQGDWRGFFKEFKEYWRILKPGGRMFISVPTLETLWGSDVGHARHICLGTLAPLVRRFKDVNEKTCATDYSGFVDPCWWLLQSIPDINDEQAFFVMRKDK